MQEDFSFYTKKNINIKKNKKLLDKQK